VSASLVHPFRAITSEPLDRRALRVLTLTPFFPSVEADSIGCFVSEPLPFTEHLGIRNEVIAVSPFYRGRSRIGPTAISSQQKTYFSFPGNFGLPAAGRFLFSGLVNTVRRMHGISPFGLIHAHGALPCGHTAMSLSKSLEIPFVVTVHGLDAFSHKQVSGKLGSWCRRVSHDVYRSAKAVICISDKVLESVGRVAANSVVVHNGVDPEMFFPAPEIHSSRTVLSVGNLIPIKGHALLIRAFARAREVVPGATLEIIGNGP
jgi:glycosyltransferase involved in cell wall biosynthesis